MFETVPFGFTDIYGIKWHDAQVDFYNKLSEEIQKREDNGFSVSEQMLCDRHRVYQLPLYHRKKGEKDDAVSRRRSVHVTFENGKHLETSINGSKETIRNYYLKNDFNLSPYREDGKEEPLTTGKSIVFLS